MDMGPVEIRASDAGSGQGAAAGSSGTLGAHLRGWLLHLSDDGDGVDTSGRRAMRLMRGALVSKVAVLLFTTVSLADLVLAESVEAVRLPLRAFLGGYSSVVAQIILARRTPVARDALSLAADVADELEAESSPPEKELLRREARTASLRTRLLVAYAVLTQVGVFVTLGTDTDSRTGRWLLAHGGPAARWGSMLVLAYGIVCCHVCLYTLLTAELTLHLACCTLYDRIGRRLRERRGAAQTARGLRMHARVNAAALLLSRVFGRLLPHFHTVGLVLPMVSTAEVILAGGRTDAFALAMVPLLFTFFVSQCVAGQRLEDCSAAVGWGAYQGPWLSEDASSRRVRLLGLQNTARPACFGVAGMASLNHRSCERALRVWFQYLQILINTTHRARR